MSGQGPRSIGDLLQGGDISRLRAKATERREMAERVRSELSGPEAQHIVSAHVDDSGQLIVGMDSAAWAARMRYSTPTLLGRTVKVRVAVPGGDGESRTKRT